ncbi:cation:proton antiporter domain-containing protein [Candidatus Berkiella aquae]|uniref:Cation:proton antiporter n=1 Tax=Candidatus Berkiella aquae TaxID=295108 RepID=A0A0Q9YLC4_9GAMM|nr:monovalent cation:proton antiporter family protein [Candidatus Berkiella aquae]MCS5711479.1 cation:proton antiporter [Candidatus Berkiella aquae]
MSHVLFNNILIILITCIVITAICQRIKLPAIIGYIVVGILVGPSGIGLISGSEVIKLIAEFGIVFLMFMVGLEFSLTHLLRLKKDVFLFGGLQVLLSILVTLVIGHLFEMTSMQLLIVGCIVAMSSTAIVIKQLTEQLEINSPYSQHAIGILLFQDLAVIPVLILLPSLSDLTIHSFINQLGLALLKGIATIIIILFIGKRILKPIFYNMSQAYSLELFTLTTLTITLFCAGITAFAGLSYSLGAFLAGMMLGETEFKHQIKTDIRPFKDILLGFFFITIGMQFNTHVIVTAWNWTLLMLVALVIFKVLLITLLGLFFTKSKVIATQTGLILAQGSEFGFAILISALSYNLLPTDYGQVILGALLLSMILAPLIIKYHQNIINLLFSSSSPTEDSEEANIHQASQTLDNHIILCGYGRVGQNIARFLEKANLQFIAFDLDPTRIKNARLAGDNVFYADVTDYEILKHAAIDKCRAVIISFINPPATNNIIEQIRKHHPKLPIIARSHDENETNVFYEKGATEVIPEILEASLMIASHILLLMNIPPKQVYNWIDESRHKRYDLLRMVFPGHESHFSEEGEASKDGLNAILLSKGSYAINRNLSELPLSKLNIKITAIRRGSQRFIDPSPSMTLLEGDIVVLYGTLSHLEHAEKVLLIGEN